MEAHGYLLTEILGNSRYVVPPWQRRYSWGENNWDAMWGSLMDVLRAPARSQHFMGALVFQRTGAVSGITVYYRVIDGQQRLVTLSLVLAALRERVPELPAAEQPQSLAGLQTLLFNPGQTGNLLARLKVVPYGADLVAYQGCLDSPPDAPPGNLTAAFVYLRTKVGSLPRSQVTQLWNAMASNLYFAAVYLEDRDDAHKIFRSLNETGLTLSPTDHIRNNLFMSAGRIGDELYQLYWEPLETLLGTDEAFLSFLYAEKARAPRAVKSVTRKDLHQVYATDFAALHGKPRKVRSYVKTIEKHGQLFAAVREPARLPSCEIKSTPALVKELKRLREWGAAPAEITTLDVLVRLQDREFQSAEALTALRVVEAFLVRRFLAGQRANVLSRIFNELIEQYGTTGRFSARLRTALSYPAHGWPAEAAVEAALTTLVDFYHQGTGAQRRFILKELNCNAVVGGVLKRVELDPEWIPDLTIEHIMPQTLDAHWRRVLAAERRARGWTESVDELHARNVNLIGNLTLARQERNNQYSNLSFEKKVVLINQELPIRLNGELGRRPYNEWGIDAIQRRSRALSRLACRIWVGPV